MTIVNVYQLTGYKSPLADKLKFQTNLVLCIYDKSRVYEVGYIQGITVKSLCFVPRGLKIAVSLYPLRYCLKSRSSRGICTCCLFPPPFPRHGLTWIRHREIYASILWFGASLESPLYSRSPTTALHIHEMERVFRIYRFPLSQAVCSLQPEICLIKVSNEKVKRSCTCTREENCPKDIRKSSTGRRGAMRRDRPGRSHLRLR